MGIYIKGIEMPKACSDCFAERCIGSDFGCDILGFDDANTTCFTKKRRKDCPLIEVPKHGRLIDADEFLHRAIGTKCFDEDDARMLQELIGESIIIIPAEEDE